MSNRWALAVGIALAIAAATLGMCLLGVNPFEYAR